MSTLTSPRFYDTLVTFSSLFFQIQPSYHAQNAKTCEQANMQGQNTDAVSETRNPVGKTVNKIWGMFSKSTDEPLREVVAEPKTHAPSIQFPQHVVIPQQQERQQQHYHHQQQPTYFQVEEPSCECRTDFLCKDFYNPPTNNPTMIKKADPYEWDV